MSSSFNVVVVDKKPFDAPKSFHSNVINFLTVRRPFKN